jgi:hypothetical protein
LGAKPKQGSGKLMLEEDPYLASNVMGFMVVIAAYLFASQKRFMLAGGLGLVPFSICAVLHEQVYWSTRRLGGFSWGVEDLLFTFSAGSLVAGIGALVFRLQMPEQVNWRLSAKKFFFIGLSGAALALLFTMMGMDIMLATIVTQISLIMILTARSRYAVGCSLATAGIYAIYYIVMLYVFFLLFPQFEYDWKGVHLWPVKIIGIPLEEIVWVFTFTWSWILILLYGLNFKIKTQGVFCEAA